MTKKKFGREEIVDYIAKENDFTKKDTYYFMDKFIEAIIKLVSSGEIVHFEGFGDFFSKTRKAGIGQNPKTGEKFKYPEEVKVKFSVAKKFKEAVNGK